MPIHFERLALYEEVWSSPLTTLAKKYGMSDNGLRKICKKLNIPLPQAGHWARVSAGQVIPKPPLPQTTDRTEFTSYPIPKLIVEKDSEDEVWLKQRLAYEEDVINRIVVDLNPEKYHPLLTSTFKTYQKLVLELKKAKVNVEKYEARAKRNTPWEPNYDGIKWRSFESSGQLLELPHTDMPFRLTIIAWQRGLAIMNCLFLSAEQRGFKIIKSKTNNSLEFEIFDQTVSIRMTEKLTKQEIPSKNLSELEILLKKNLIKVPTGILKILLTRSFTISEVEISDSAEPLEQKLNSVFSKIYPLIVRSRNRARELEEQRQENRKREKLRLALEEDRREKQRLAELELQKRQALIKEADEWHSAKLIREYVNHLDMNSSSDDSAEWREWALNVAEDIDPTNNRIRNKQ